MPDPSPRTVLAEAAELLDLMGHAWDATSPEGQRIATAATRLRQVEQARPLDDWHEDDGPVLWWSFPISEPPFAGTPLDSDWPGYHTHWTPIIVPAGILHPADATEGDGNGE